MTPHPTPPDAVAFLRDAARVTLADGAAAMFTAAADELELLRRDVADLTTALMMDRDRSNVRLIGLLWRRR